MHPLAFGKADTLGENSGVKLGELTLKVAEDNILRKRTCNVYILWQLFFFAGCCENGCG